MALMEAFNGRPAMKKFSLRANAVLTGLYLSKFDVAGLHQLGFQSFTEAFNVIGCALGAQPASIKNYRDEFDPLFPNSRQGWHKRTVRKYCQTIYDDFGQLKIEEFSTLLKQRIYHQPTIDVLMEDVEHNLTGEPSSFAKRLVTGQAAEQYFMTHYQEIACFHGYAIENTTALGCGFDFQMTSAGGLYCVEVKGLHEPSGNISLTHKEHAVAARLADTYFLFVVKNFQDHPFHELYRNPLNSNLAFHRLERDITQVSWVANV